MFPHVYIYLRFNPALHTDMEDADMDKAMKLHHLYESLAVQWSVKGYNLHIIDVQKRTSTEIASEIKDIVTKYVGEHHNKHSCSCSTKESIFGSFKRCMFPCICSSLYG